MFVNYKNNGTIQNEKNKFYVKFSHSDFFINIFYKLLYKKMGLEFAELRYGGQCSNVGIVGKKNTSGKIPTTVVDCEILGEK